MSKEKPTSVILKLPEDNIRRQAWEAAKTLRASWLKVAEYITAISYGGDYKEWGYADFSEYLKADLNLSERQAGKMMRALNTVKSENDHYKKYIEGKDMPPGYEALSDLNAAESMEGRYDADQLKEIKAKLLDNEITGKEASASIRQARIEEDYTPSEEKEFKKLLKAFNNVKYLLDGNAALKIPADLREKITDIIYKIEELR